MVMYFSKKFDAEKVVTEMAYKININVPPSVSSNENITLHFQVRKISMKNLFQHGKDKFHLNDVFQSIETEVTHVAKNYTAPKALLY